ALVDRISFVFFPSFSVSSNGILIYAGTNPTKDQPTWFDRDGRITGKSGAPDVYFGFQPSPDGTRVAATVFEPQTSGSDLWMLEPTGVRTRTTFDPHGFPQSPIWSSDGTHLTFAVDRGAGALDIYQKAANGAAEETLL